MTMADVCADLEFNDLTGPQLVEAYNEMLATWTDLGGDNRYGTARRFSTADNGRRRCRDLHAAITELRSAIPPAPPAAEAACGRGRPRADRVPYEEGRPLRSYTEEFNALVPRAQHLGIRWARPHRSLFESRAKAAAQLARLVRSIADAEAAQ